MQYTIADGEIKAIIDTMGAEAVSVIYRGHERLWQNDNGSWTGHAPHLFPVCGKCGITVDGKTYPVKQHGFARNNEFALVEASKTSAEFVLCANEGTKELYPFDFKFYIKFTVAEDTLCVAYTVVNPSDKTVYFSCGGHESFALADDVDNYALLFESEEVLTSLVHDANGRLTGDTLALGKTKHFPLPAEKLQNGNTLIFPSLASRKVTLERITGEKEADISFDGFENLLLWHPLGSRMICIEPWGNLPDCVGKENVEFSQKGGIQKVAPGHSVHIERKIKYY